MDVLEGKIDLLKGHWATELMSIRQTGQEMDEREETCLFNSESINKKQAADWQQMTSRWANPQTTRQRTEPNLHLKTYLLNTVVNINCHVSGIKSSQFLG